jgi:hypothetical protein
MVNAVIQSDVSLADIAGMLASATAGALPTTALVMADLLTDRVGEEAAEPFRKRLATGHKADDESSTLLLNDLLWMLGGWKRCETCVAPFLDTPCLRCGSLRYASTTPGMPGTPWLGIGFDPAILPRHTRMENPGENATIDASGFEVGGVLLMTRMASMTCELRTLSLGIKECRVTFESQRRWYSYEFFCGRRMVRSDFGDDLTKVTADLNGMFLMTPAGILGYKRQSFGKFLDGQWSMSFKIGGIPEPLIFPGLESQQ